MGVAITQLLEGREVPLTELRGKVLVVDAFNMLYQFLTTIRMRDGTPLTDSKGRVTSHLIGLFSRTTRLMSDGLKLAFVFDGDPPPEKAAERERRAQAKATALQHLATAQQEGDVEAMARYASRSATLSPPMVEEAKKLVGALGLPVIQAPSEGEAQAAHLCKRGDAFAVVSQDADAFLFGAPRVVRNLSVTGRRKQRNALAYERVTPELLVLADTLGALKINHDQLIILALLVGTDYNRQGIKGVGPKKALKLLREYGEEYERLFAAVDWPATYPPWRRLFTLFKEMPVTDDYQLAWRAPDEAALKKLLVEEHEFREERITQALTTLRESSARQQRSLGEFL